MADIITNNKRRGIDLNKAMISKYLSLEVILNGIHGRSRIKEKLFLQ